MNAIPSLWPDDIKLNIVSPAAILRAQAGYLTERTQGIIRAEVETASHEGDYIHRFVLLAPALEMYRRVLLVARHSQESPYPVKVESEFPQPPQFPELSSFQRSRDEGLSYSEFLNTVRQILGCEGVRVILESLIARSNDFRNDQGETERPPTDDQQSMDEEGTP